MAAHKEVAGESRGRKYYVGELNRGAVLLLNAHFEGYLEDVLAETLNALNRHMNSQRLNRSFMNPTPDKIDGLFELLGMERPSRRVRWRNASNTRVRGALKSLVEVRNALAHGEMGVSVLKKDVTRYRKYVEGFASRFDDAVLTHAREKLGVTPW